MSAGPWPISVGHDCADGCSPDGTCGPPRPGRGSYGMQRTLFYFPPFDRQPICKFATTWDLWVWKKGMSFLCEEVDSRSKVCPICQYQFVPQSGALKWAAILLALLFLLYLIIFWILFPSTPCLPTPAAALELSIYALHRREWNTSWWL